VHFCSFFQCINLQVLYGDIDSVMINTGLGDVNKAYDDATVVMQEV
jgi:DNA polymerase family B